MRGHSFPLLQCPGNSTYVAAHQGGVSFSFLATDLRGIGVTNRHGHRKVDGSENFLSSSWVHLLCPSNQPLSAHKNNICSAVCYAQKQMNVSKRSFLTLESTLPPPTRSPPFPRFPPPPPSSPNPIKNPSRPPLPPPPVPFVPLVLMVKALTMLPPPSSPATTVRSPLPVAGELGWLLLGGRRFLLTPPPDVLGRPCSACLMLGFFTIPGGSGGGGILFRKAQCPLRPHPRIRQECTQQPPPTRLDCGRDNKLITRT